ncbi:MAG TPA: carbohydrate kinase [Actinomycetes bacterium]|jgi:fructokinase|nr:carbohydrate kinase [Actinomycetes bacterium]
MSERPTRHAAARGGGVIVTAGEALVDLVLGVAGDLQAHPGGGPFNVARTIGRLQRPVAFLGRVSGDRFGRLLRECLAADGVLPDAIVPTEQPTTLALAEIDADGRIAYRFYAQATSAPGLTPEEAVAALPDDVTMLHVGGLGLVFEPMATALEAAVATVSGQAVVSLDPNCRPWAMDDAATYRRRLARLLRQAGLVKVSEEDLAWLDPGRDPVDAARALLDRGPLLVILTLGPLGAVALTADEQVTVPSPPVAVQDTIGAGDAFCGAFLAWWRSRALGRDSLTQMGPVSEALRFACLVAARTCERAGASPPWLSELDA